VSNAIGMLNAVVAAAPAALSFLLDVFMVGINFTKEFTLWIRRIL